jgi:hypothetical protein
MTLLHLLKLDLTVTEKPVVRPNRCRKQTHFYHTQLSIILWFSDWVRVPDPTGVLFYLWTFKIKRLAMIYLMILYFLLCQNYHWNLWIDLNVYANHGSLCLKTHISWACFKTNLYLIIHLIMMIHLFSYIHILQLIMMINMYCILFPVRGMDWANIIESYSHTSH